MDENPKAKPTDNAEKDPQDWVTGDEPMTGAQASYLKTLSEQTDQPEAYDETLTKAQASERIETLKLARNTVKQKERLMEPKN
jgi:hypothetical protein